MRVDYRIDSSGTLVNRHFANDVRVEVGHSGELAIWSADGVLLAIYAHRTWAFLLRA